MAQADLPRAYSYLRFSSKKQEKGESRRRQWDFAVEVSTEHGWVLDEGLTLTDLGVSAFRGKNAKVGALAEFLEAIRVGRVLRGSILIVESIDRLSRSKLGDALQLFISILNAGVEIVTREPRRHYTKASINDLAALIEPLVYMMRAHEESATKAYRLRDVWGKKKDRAREQGLPMTKNCPRWLELTETGYKLIPDRAATVRDIFKMCREGLGIQRIQKVLIADPVKYPPFTKTGKWRDSYVTQILGNRAAFGEFQPGGRDEEGGKTECGPPISGYFPAVISETDWYATQATMKARHRTTGKPGEQETNLFTGLLTCTSDGGKMFAKTFRQPTRKGEPTKAYTYLCAASVATGASRRGNGLSFPYDVFEEGVLRALSELATRDVLPGEEQLDENERAIAKLHGDLQVLDHRIETYEKKVVDLELADDDDSKAEAECATGVLKGLHRKKTDTVRELELRKADTAKCKTVNLMEPQSLIELLATTPAKEKAEVRRKLKARIRALLADVQVDIKQEHQLKRQALVTLCYRSGVTKEVYLRYERPRSEPALAS